MILVKALTLRLTKRNCKTKMQIQSIWEPNRTKNY